MKKFTAVLLCFLILLTTAACQSQPETTAPPAPHEIKNIILIIGDGFGLGHMEAAEIASGKDAPYRSWPSVKSDTSNVYGALTDSAAGATAIATGTLTAGGIIGQDRTGNNLDTILDYAALNGKSTGIVTTDGLAGATPGAFSAHTPNRDNYDDIMIGQFTSGVTLLCGQQTSSALTLSSGNKYNFTYTVCKNSDEVEKNMNAGNVYWQLPLEEDLTMAVEPALRFLSQDSDGFVLMIEQAHIDKYADDNDIAGVLRCVNDLNETVETVLNWIGDRNDTAVIVTADHETGWLKVSKEPEYMDSYESEIGNTLYYFFGTDKHTLLEVGVYIYGYTPDFTKYYMEGSTTTIKNASIYNIMKDLIDDPMRT